MKRLRAHTQACGLCIPVLHDTAVEGDNVSNLDLVDDVAIEDIETLRGGGILVGSGRTQVDALAALGSNQALDVGDVLVLEGRDELVTVDLGDGQGSR